MIATYTGIDHVLLKYGVRAPQAFEQFGGPLLSALLALRVIVREMPLTQQNDVARTEDRTFSSAPLNHVRTIDDSTKRIVAARSVLAKYAAREHDDRFEDRLAFAIDAAGVSERSIARVCERDVRGCDGPRLVGGDRLLEELSVATTARETVRVDARPRLSAVFRFHGCASTTKAMAHSPSDRARVL